MFGSDVSSSSITLGGTNSNIVGLGTADNTISGGAGTDSLLVTTVSLMDSVTAGNGANYVSIGTSVNTSTLVGELVLIPSCSRLVIQVAQIWVHSAHSLYFAGVVVNRTTVLVVLALTPSTSQLPPVLQLMQELTMTASTSVYSEQWFHHPWWCR